MDKKEIFAIQTETTKFYITKIFLPIKYEI